MDIDLSISAAPGIATNYLVVAVYEATAINTVVSVQAFAAPHTAPRNINFTNLNAVTHQVIIWESPTTSPSGVIRHNFLYHPTYKSVQVRDDLFLTESVTDGFNAGATTYSNPTLIGWKYDIERRGFGTMEPGIDYTMDTAAGSWSLVYPDDTVKPGETFILHFQPQIITIAPQVNQTSGFLFGDAVVVEDDIDLDYTYLGKVVHLQGAGDHFAVKLPDLSSVPEMKMIGFVSEGGNHINAVLQAFGSDLIRFGMGTNQGPVSAVGIAQAEQICFYKKFGVWNVLFPFGNFLTAGEIVHSYLLNQHGTTFTDGELRSRTAYWRLFQYVLSLDSSEVVSDNDWQNASLNLKGKFSLGDGSTTFRVPLLYSAGFLRGVDGITRKAGTWQDDSNKRHGHNVSTTGAQTGVNPGMALQRSNTPSSGLGNENNDPGSGPTKYIREEGGEEAKPKNTAVYLSMRY